MQPIADGVKNFVKEETYPAVGEHSPVVLAPALPFIPALVTWAVIPFAAPWEGRWGRIDMVLAPLPIGFLFILAISSLASTGSCSPAGSSNNKYRCWAACARARR
jgi:NADH-quinone oxidoreductase subunit H